MYQRKYALDLLVETGLLSAKPCSTLMDPVAKLHKKSGGQLTDTSSYRRLIGRILYLTSIKANITFVGHHLSQFLDYAISDQNKIRSYLKSVLLTAFSYTVKIVS